MNETNKPQRERFAIMLTVAGMLIALLIQSAALVSWGAKLDNRVAQLEARAVSASGLAETVARVDERTASLVTTINRIDSRLTDEERRR